MLSTWTKNTSIVAMTTGPRQGGGVSALQQRLFVSVTTDVGKPDATSAYPIGGMGYGYSQGYSGRGEGGRERVDGN